MGASTDAKRRPVSHPRSSNRTCGFPASGFPTGFTVNSRTRSQLYLTELENPQLAKNDIIRETCGAARPHLVTPPQEMPHAIRNVMIDRPIRLRPSAIAEVRRPASQNLIQPSPYVRPRPQIAGNQKVSHLFLDARHRLLRRTRPQIPVAIFPVAVWPERVPQKVKALFARLLDSGLGLIRVTPMRVTTCRVQFSASTA